MGPSVPPGHCGYLDLLAREQYHPGTQLERPDGYNDW